MPGHRPAPAAHVPNRRPPRAVVACVGIALLLTGGAAPGRQVGAPRTAPAPGEADRTAGIVGLTFWAVRVPTEGQGVEWIRTLLGRPGRGSLESAAVAAAIAEQSRQRTIAVVSSIAVAVGPDGLGEAETTEQIPLVRLPIEDGRPIPVQDVQEIGTRAVLSRSPGEAAGEAVGGTRFSYEWTHAVLRNPDEPSLGRRVLSARGSVVLEPGKGATLAVFREPDEREIVLVVLAE